MMTTSRQPSARDLLPHIIGLCIECALRHQVFSEALAPPVDEEDWPDASRPEAWIDGRRYDLWSSFGILRPTCTECDREVSNVYVVSR